MPAAPERFSITTDWPRSAAMAWASMRAMRSAVPPGAKPTTSRTGRSGQDGWATALPAARASPAAAINPRLFINVFLLSGEGGNRKIEAAVGLRRRFVRAHAFLHQPQQPRLLLG